jgi:hypothetical protein
MAIPWPARTRPFVIGKKYVLDVCWAYEKLYQPRPLDGLIRPRSPVSRPHSAITKGENQMFTRTCLAVAVAGLLPLSASAYDLKFNGNDYGKFSAMAKAMHIVSDAGNGFDPSNGSSYLLKLKYQTPNFGGLRVNLGQYITGDLFGLTDFSPTPGEERLARGMFMNADGDTDYQLGEIFLKYQGEAFDFQIGRGLLDTPLTKNTYSNTPNFYSAAMADVRPMEGLSVGAGLITEMSYGARAATDWGLIGEGTPTGGAARDPREEGSGGISQGKFYEIGELAGGAGSSTTGIAVLNATYTGVENLTLAGWNYYADDIANSMYFQADYAIPVKSLKSKLTFSGQYLRQRGTGDEITVGATGSESVSLDYDMFGGKVALGNKRWSVYGAFNSSSGDSYFWNGVGGDPAFTSTIFSRNTYRENVDAWKVGGSFSPMKGVRLMAHYADYGQSDTLGYGQTPAFTPQSDAKELDLVAVWKPRKDLTLRAVYVKRTSEYDGTAAGPRPPANIADKTQDHFRIIGVYNFK